MIVVQFAEVRELLEETFERETVRVVPLELALPGTEEDRSGLRFVMYGVHVRTVLAGEQVGACCVSTRVLPFVGNVPVDGTERRAEAWREIQELAKRLTEWIAGYTDAIGLRRFEVRPGVIDIGDTRIMAGRWSEGDERGTDLGVG